MVSGERLRAWHFTVRGDARYILTLFDPNDHDSAGRWGVAYTLHRVTAAGRELLFDSDANGIAYAHLAVDSDERAHDTMKWLTLKPGDTDRDFFDKYTPDQLAWATSHAEGLEMEVMFRWTCPECGEFSKRARKCKRCR